MKAKAYTEEEIKALVEAFGHPMVAVRESVIVAVNEAYLRSLSQSRENLEGRPFVDLLPEEERRWLVEWSNLRRKGFSSPRGPHSLLALGGDGRLLRLDVSLDHVPAEAGGDFTLASCFRVTREEPKFDLTELLVQISRSLVSQRSVDTVRNTAIEGLARGGFAAAFYRIDGDKLTLSYGPERGHSPNIRYAFDAVKARRPIFAPNHEVFAPSDIFLAIGESPSGQELLLISGQHTVHDAAVWSLFSQVVTAALASARLHAESWRQLNESRTLLELARTTAGTLELETILEVACDSLVKLLDMSNCFIMLNDERAHTLRGAAASSPHRDVIRSLSIRIDNPMSTAARTAREKKTCPVEDIAKTPGLSDPSLVAQFAQTAVIGFPLLSREQLVGVVILGETRGPRHFAPEWLELAEATVGQLALSIANARLYESLRRSYSELEATRAEAAKREELAALGELSAIIAHEVRNPLGVIFNAISSLRRLQPSPQTRLLLDIISEESNRLNQMTEELLNFARPANLSMQPEDLSRVIQESMDAAMQQNQVSGNGSVAFESHIQEDLPRVPLDRRLIRQALVNVALNAFQATPRGGTVRVSARREHWKNGDWVLIDLEDQGPGIPQSIGGRIFEPFFTTKATGTGLGLAVVKRIVEDHHGEVEVTSMQGGGARFTLRLPLQQTDGRQP